LREQVTGYTTAYTFPKVKLSIYLDGKAMAEIVIEILKEDFETENLIKLYLLKQGYRTAEELVTEFRFLASRA
jgi:hypothetical protein